MRSQNINAEADNVMADWAMLAGAAHPHTERITRKNREVVEYTPKADHQRVASMRQWYLGNIADLLAAIGNSELKEGGESAADCLRRIWKERKYCAEAVDAAMGEYENQPPNPTTEDIERDTDAAIARARALIDGTDGGDAADEDGTSSVTLTARPSHAAPLAGATA